MSSLFSKIAGMFNRASQPDIEEDFDPLDEDWEEELHIFHPDDTLDQGDSDDSSY